ncbi:MAG: amidohydrolase [Bacteroidales bacterium]|nr:amidohydrolase [Bacteroidales bacterium]
MKVILSIFSLLFLFTMAHSCSDTRREADLIVSNAIIYTVDNEFSVAQSMAVGNDKILAVGSNEEIRKQFKSKQMVDAGGKPIYPGFIDAHSHFIGYAIGLQMAILNGLNSFEEVIEALKTHEINYSGEWLVGRGWDQNRWPGKEFPSNKLLDQAFPTTPVVLVRVDGHAVIVNNEAMQRLGINEATKFPDGEAIYKKNELIGVFLESIADRFKAAIPPLAKTDLVKLLLRAQKNCVSVGLTSVCDAGLSRERVLMLDSLHKSGELALRIYAMLDPSEENIEYFVRKGIYKTDRLSVRSIKLYADGALGSRGARLIEPYSDAPGQYGLWVHSPDEMQLISRLALDNGYQVCIHCIGDAAVRRVLNIYSEFLPENNDLRWRIEHVQVVHPEDFDVFKKYNIVPSIQSTHATSDMYWAGSRVGEHRLQYAYAQQRLLAQNGWLPNGTDFPIEGISPINTFYAAVARKDLSGFPEGGFQSNDALSREQALRSITIWAAKAAFEENEKGSLEPGKFADFVILDQDLMTVAEEKIPLTKALSTWIGGKQVY